MFETLMVPLALVAVVLVLAVPAVPLSKLLLLVLIGRSFTEAVGNDTVSSAFSSGLGLLAIAAVFLSRSKPVHPRLQVPIVLVLLVLAVGGLTRFVLGASPVLAFRETITLASVLAVFVLSFSFAASNLDRALKYLVWCAVPATLISVAGFYAGLPGMMLSGERLNGTFSHANTAGAFFALSALLTLCLSLNLKRPRLLWVSALSILGLVASQSIGAWIGLLAALAVFVVATSAISGAQKAVLIVGSSVVSLVAINRLGLPDRVSEFVGFNADAAISSGVATNSLDWRLVNWHLLMGLWRERPIFGYGIGSTSTTVMPLGAPPHSLPIQLLLEVGVVGCAVIAVVLLMVLVRVIVALQGGSWEAALLLALATFVVVNGSESNLLNYTPAMYLLALALGVLTASMTVPRPRHLAAQFEKVWRRPWRLHTPPPAHSSQSRSIRT
jgi:O-antigen ligase